MNGHGALRLLLLGLHGHRGVGVGEPGKGYANLEKG